jgi:hypothetical protein
MKKTLAFGFGVALMAAGAAYADDDVMLTQPMKLGDQAMSCSAIIDEVAGMETLLGGSPSAGLMDGEQMASLGTGLAQRAALQAGVGGKAFGAIGQVGGLLGRSSKKKKEQEALQQAVAEKRWLYMVGLYQGKSCDSQLAAVADQPAGGDTSE